MQKQINLNSHELNPNTSIKNDKAKGTDTSKMVSVRITSKEGSLNTIIFCHPDEVDAVRKQYSTKLESYGTAPIRKGKGKQAKKPEPEVVSEDVVEEIKTKKIEEEDED